MKRWNNIKPIDVNYVIENYGKLTTHQIAKNLNATTDRIRRVLKMNGIVILGKSDLYKNIKENRFDYEDDLCNDYIIGLSQLKLCKKYKISNEKVKFLLERNNIHRDKGNSNKLAWKNGIRKPRNCNKGGSKDIHNALFNRWRRNAESRKYIFNVSVEYLQEILEKQNFKCAYTNIDMLCPKTYNEKREMTSSPYLISLDRIDSEYGYIENNVHFVCVWVNKAKGNYEHELFKELLYKFKNAL